MTKKIVASMLEGLPSDYTIKGRVIEGRGTVTAIGYEFYRFSGEVWRIVDGKFAPMHNVAGTVTGAPIVPSEATTIGQALINKIGLEAARNLVK